MEAAGDLFDQMVDRLRSDAVPLGERLAAMRLAIADADPGFTAVVDRYVARLHAAGSGDTAPAVGTRFPDFLLPDQDGRLTALADLLSPEGLLVAFHRGHWCPYCRLSLHALGEAARQPHAPGMVAISGMIPRRLAEFRADADVDFPLLCDMDLGFALSIGLAIVIDADFAALIGAYGIDIATYQGSGGWLLPIPAWFLLDADGIIRSRFVEPDYRLRGDPAAVLARSAAASSPPTPAAD